MVWLPDRMKAYFTKIQCTEVLLIFSQAGTWKANFVTLRIVTTQQHDHSVVVVSRHTQARRGGLRL